jgi:fibronectin type 3 domain-containing protein
VTYTNTGRVAGNTYAYYVTAVNAAGPSLASNTVSVVFAAPAVPSGLTGAAVRINGNTTQDKVTLNWTDNSTSETLFTIQRATNAAFTAGVASYTVAANVNTFSQNVTRRTTITTPPTNGYYWRVRATNLIGNSTWTPGLFVTTP